jgi:hypothetical protein
MIVPRKHETMSDIEDTLETGSGLLTESIEENPRAFFAAVSREDGIGHAAGFDSDLDPEDESRAALSLLAAHIETLADVMRTDPDRVVQSAMEVGTGDMQWSVSEERDDS